MRKALIAGNWKMYHTPQSAVTMLNELKPLVAAAEAEVLLCMPATHLQAAAETWGAS